MNRSSSSFSNVGFLGLLTILFIGLKLTGCISWSWWLVLSPIWIALVLVIVIFAIVFVGVVLWEVVKGR